MHKLMVIFRAPDNVIDFERAWSETFVPIAEEMPGIRRVAVSRIMGGPADEVDLHLVHEFYFDNKEDLKSAMLSEQGQKAGRALMIFAAPFTEICYAEHLEQEIS